MKYKQYSAKPSRNSTHYFFPLIWGILMFTILRAVTDFTKREAFYSGEMKMHLIGLIFSILLCYAYDFFWRKMMGQVSFRSNTKKNISFEYGMVFLQTAIAFNILIFTGQKVEIFQMGSGWVDYMLINATYLPLLLIYYTILRNEAVRKTDMENEMLMEKLKADQIDAELKFLKSQYHPHFLFNALNTIYVQINEENRSAKESIEQLSDLLRYQLYAAENLVNLKQEIKYLKSYMAFQKLRMPERLTLTINLNFNSDELQIQPLLFQPLIENAFKYVRGAYTIDVQIWTEEDKSLYFKASNSIKSTLSPDKKKEKGIGIENLRRRLELLYPEKHQLNIEHRDNLYTVTLILELT